MDTDLPQRPDQARPPKQEKQLLSYTILMTQKAALKLDTEG